MDRGKITGIEFDVLRSHDILKLSVVEDSEESAFGPILKPKDLYDARFGIPNESRVCQTCGGTRRGVCDAPHSCDGHFGHVELPSAIYHPYHVRRVVKLLSKICLGCSKALRKKGRANFLLLDSDRDSQESGTVKKVTRKRKLSETQADKKVVKSRKRSDLLKWLNAMRSEEDVPVKEEIYDHVYAAENGSWQSSVARSVPTPPLIRVKEELIDDITDPVRTEPPIQKEMVHDAAGRSNTKDGTKCGTSGGFNGPDKSGLKDAEKVPMKPREESEDSPPVQPGEEILEGSTENSCKYCGVNRKELGPRFPKINLRVVTKVKRSGKIETIKMVVDEKPGDSQLPGGFWDFVNGHPGSETEKSRLLLPFEALNILRRVPVEDHARLNMDKVVTHPEAFILFTIPVTPNCNRLIMDDWNSTLMPRIILGRGGPNRNLEALVSKVKQIASCVGKKTFETEVLDVDELQLLVARHLRACKVVEFSLYSKQETVEKQEGRSLELKWLKTHVLSKRSNYSARTIVNGDPNISIEEIGVPYEMALHLTLDERINRLNLRKWQKVISAMKGGRMVSPPGPVLLRTRNRLFDLREKCLAWTSYVVKVGDVLTRCLQNGDYVFANRPPSLHKHSLIALKVKLHHQLTFAINPLICAPFDGDFDGDAFHVYVPQSVESMAELRELMSVSAQMVCPQGGQALISLTQDTLLGGHMITRSHSFLNQAEMSQLSMFCSAGMPPPAIVKSPARTGPLWTGKQLYGMTFPRDLDYGSPDGDVFVRHGEILICKGNSGWLGASVNGMVKAICEFAGSDAALHYLNSAQALLHQWFMNRGFSVGLKDFYVAKNRESRSTMVHGVRKCLRISEEASLRQVLKLDKTVQARILSPKPNCHENVEYIKHGGCFGLLLGDSRRYTKIKDLQRSAIEKFQSLVPIVDNLIYGYMDSDNSLLAMVRSGSKGSMSRLIQQTACLGLQLYKGESLISVKDPNNKLFYYNQSLKFRREDVFDNKDEIICQPGYWESKGIIASSFFDGLNPAEFYLHALSSRGSMLREGIEEPNKIMRNLFLFMRDLYVAYDGSVRSRSGNRIIQFQYGGLRAEDCREAAHMAGEPVGALAATAVAEPSYSVKMDAYHSSSLLKAGPIQLLQETLFPRRKSTLKMRDRSVILRLYPGFGVHRRALRLKRELEKVPFSKFVSSLALEFSGDGGSYEKVYYEKTKPSYEIVKRSCPWQCRVLLNKKALRDYELDVSTVKTRLNREFNSATSREALPSIVFLNQFICTSRGQSGIIDECLVFFLHESGNEASLSTTPASELIKVGKEAVPGDMLKQGKQEKQKISFERMINVIIPRILVTTVKALLKRAERARREGPASKSFWVILSVFSLVAFGFPRFLRVVLALPLRLHGPTLAAWGLPMSKMTQQTKVCSLCNDGDEDTVHYLVDCAKFGTLRMTLFSDIRKLTPSDLFTRFSRMESKPKAAALLSTSFCGQPDKVSSIYELVKSFLAETWKNKRSLCRTVYIDFSCGLLAEPRTRGMRYPPLSAPALGRGNDDIEVVKLVWEDSDGASRVPKPSHYPRFTSHRSSDTGELCLEVRTNKMKGAGKRGAAYSAVKRASVLFLDEIDWARSTPYSIQEITHVFGVEAARQSMKKRLGLATKDMGKPVREEHLTLVADTMTFSGEVVGLSLSGYRDYCKDPSMSTPFMEASFQEPKKNFFEMAVVGARDNLDGALACAVWGRRIPLGTGADFDALPKPALKYEVQSNDSHEKSGSAKRSRAEVKTEKEGKACCAREGKNGLKDGVHKSLFRSPPLSAVKEAQSNHDTGDFRPGSTSPFKKGTGTILNGLQEEKGSTPNGTNSASKLPGGHRRHLNPMMDAGSCKQTLIKQARSGVDGLQMFEDFSKDVETDKELFQKLQNLLHERYEAGEIVDKESEKMLLEEVLIRHPRRKEKIGCGVSFIKVDYHPKYPATKCFHIVRIDGSTCDFSYHKCLQNTYSRFPA